MPNSVRSTVVFRRRSAVVLLAMALAGGVSCGKGDDRVVAPAPPSAPSASEPPPPPAPAPVPPPGAAAIATDADLFALVTSVEPFHASDLFPNADEITSGRLNGSGAHQPLVRTSLNLTAVGALKDGTLPSSASTESGDYQSSYRRARGDGAPSRMKTTPIAVVSRKIGTLRTHMTMR